MKQIFSRSDFERAVKQHKADRAAKGFDCWTQFVSMLFCQVGRAHSLREICGGLASSLSDHASFISTKVNFLLDATLGLINNEQNGIIRIVSVAAGGLSAPTLVASVYGMNFDVMPELKLTHFSIAYAED